MSMHSESANNQRTNGNQTNPKEPEPIVKQQIKRQNELKKILTPRDTLFQPRRSVFNRFNYQNYENYTYQNPFKPKKYPIQDKMLQSLKNNPNHGSDKNLEIIFCEHRYKDFVDKSNKQFKQFYETSRQFPLVEAKNRVKAKSQLNLKKDQSQSKSKMYAATSQNFSTKKRKTTLSTYLKQFNTLQRLSQYMIRQQKLNQKYLLFSIGDSSRTVLLQVVFHRFQFLKKMKKKARDLIFKILLGPQSSNPLYKINIQDYIKLIELFVSKDADPNLTAIFTFKFLFKNEESICMDSALAALDLIGNTVSKHKFVQQRIQAILNESQNSAKWVFQRIRKDQILLNAFIDLITSNI